MENKALRDLLNALYNQGTTVEKALDKLKDMPFHDLGFAKIDHHRALRKGFPEVIFCQNKAPEHILAIAKEQVENGETVFGTRAEPSVIEMVAREIPGIEQNALARCFWWKSPHWKAKGKIRGPVVIASGGTADASVAEEARCTVELLGHPCRLLQDVGVAGIHRLFAHKEDLHEASVIIAVAGMEGALPSVIAGYVSCPVIGVPTSVGYGSHLEGLVPLFAMLNSCSSGMTVVNIDNGFGAGYAAALINGK
ncbi:MAG: nickel pincer cofactor biosynthesis protein LarB [Chitinivibrionales bacterium]|nr:nickel pincer cofactor biosynthesis protein LarB [Chitinivibrionales bacterium]